MQRFQSSWRPGFGHVPLVLIMALLLYPGLKNIVVYLHSAVTGSYISGTHSVVFISCPNEQVGKIIARTIMEKKLAACVNIVPEVFSMYNWDSEITETIEVLMVIKTRSTKMRELTEFIRESQDKLVEAEPDVLAASVESRSELKVPSEQSLKAVQRIVPNPVLQTGNIPRSRTMCKGTHSSWGQLPPRHDRERPLCKAYPPMYTEGLETV